MRTRAGVAAVVFMVMAIAVPASAADPQGTKAVLVLHTYGTNRPVRTVVDAALARAFREAADVKVDLYVESVDSDRFAGESQARLLRDYLRTKYAGKSISVIVTVFDGALGFVLDRSDPLLPGVPIAALVTRFSESYPERVAAIWSGNQFGETLAVALRLHPRTGQIAVIDSAFPRTEAVHAQALSQITAIGTRLPVTFLRDLPLPELLTRVATMPPDSVIIMARQMIGRQDEPINDVDSLPEIARVARAPIYVVSDQMVGLGAVGGIVVSTEGQATQLARLAIRLAGNPSLRIPLAEGARLPMFDWRQLKRWGVDQHQLPPHSDVRFREVTFWDQHQWAAIVMVSVVVIQSALISGLLFQRVRRRRAEGALRDTESALRVSDRQVQSLAGRLITAQEAERARIARELHDDLSQKLALLSIELEQFVDDGAASDTVKRQARAASARAAEIATDVHNLSHELHPARLEMLGLAPALRGLCDEMSSGHNIEIQFERAPIPGSIPYEVSLCLFRVAQEGLRNVIKHSGARRATVTLWHADGLLALQIADSGCGFASERDGDGLGLVSMRERALVVGAQFMVQSHQGRGTRLAVTVPVTWVGAPASEALPATGRRAAVVPPLRRRA
jgi:signal transduction histidine kinase